MASISQTIDAMQNTLNFVLIEVGKAFQKSTRDGKTVPPAGNMRVQTGIPRLADRFHSALDDLEDEIVRAKAVLLHDFEQLQAKKAAAIRPKPEPVVTPDQPSGRSLEEIPSVPISVMDFRDSASQPQMGRGVESGTTLDRLQKNIGNVQKIVRSPNAVGNEFQAAKGVADPSSQTALSNNQILPNESLFESPTDTNNEAEKSAGDRSKKSDYNLSDETSKDSIHDIEVSQSNDEAQTANAQANSTDFDSLFDGNNSNSNTNQSDNADFADIDFTIGDDFTFPTTTTAPTNADLDSLMPGSESYAPVNPSDDFNMLDLPANTDATGGNGNSNGDTTMDAMFDLSNTGSGGNGGDSSNNDMGIATESAFDDLLDGMDFDADDGIGGGDMEHGEFDAAFFGLTE